MRLFSNRSQLTSKCGQNKKVAHEAQPSVSVMFLLHFDVLCDLLGSLSKHDVDESENVIWKCDLAFLQSFFNYSNSLCLEPALGTWEDKFEHLSSYAHVVHTATKQVISRHIKNENVYKMSKNEKCTCKACKNTVFHCQICKFVGFLLPSSSWLLKLPNDRHLNYSFMVLI